MREAPKPKGPWINRFLTRLLTLILAILIFWLLGFLLQDIRSIKGPDRQAYELEHIDQQLLAQIRHLKSRISETERKLSETQNEQRIVGDRSRNLQLTINQLLELQKLSIEKDRALTESDQTNLDRSMQHFMESQKAYQTLNTRMAELNADKLRLEEEKRSADYQMATQRDPVDEAFRKLVDKHKMKLAMLQLAILIPLLALASFLVLRKRSHIYFPLFIAFGLATLIKVALVIHEYFPTRLFKYVLITVLLLVVGRLLVHFIRIVAFPKAPWLIKQYRDAYERFFCPVCEYPIRTGPRVHLFWTRKSVKKMLPQLGAPSPEETYTCPSCGTSLFGACSACGKVRHTLLPNCRHCGEETAVPGTE